MNIRRRTYRCAGCGVSYAVLYAEGTLEETMRNASEVQHRLRSRLCVAGPSQRSQESDEIDLVQSLQAGGARPDGVG